MSEVDSTVEYRFVPGFPAYRVGTDGSVWSRWKKMGRKGQVIGDQWKKLTFMKSDDGRRQLVLCAGKTKRRTIRVASLILEVFVGPRPPGMEACHFPDSNPGNNELANLRWDTRANNEKDKVAHGTHNRGDQHPLSKITSAVVIEIRHLHDSGQKTQKELCHMFGLSSGHMSLIVRRKLWKHLS